MVRDISILKVLCKKSNVAKKALFVPLRDTHQRTIILEAINIYPL